MLPYKRYASHSLLPLVGQYVDQDEVSYQRVAAPQGMVRGYVTAPDQAEIDERALHRTTLWRWAMFLGAQLPALQQGIALYLEWQPRSTGRDADRFLS